MSDDINDKIVNTETAVKASKKLYDFIMESDNIVFFGGAGVSTESGIPDFRSKDGLYNQHDVQFDQYEPEYLLSTECLHHNPKVFYEFYRQKMDARGIMPNITHYVLAKLEQMGKLKAVITQNIDGLHQAAGSKEVLELHGTVKKKYCMNGRKFYDEEYIMNTSGVPKCDCGGTIKPYVVPYEDSPYNEVIEYAVDYIRPAAVLIIAGTSLTVYPAAGLIDYYRGDKLVLINKSVTPKDNIADLVIHEPVGETLGGIVLNS